MRPLRDALLAAGNDLERKEAIIDADPRVQAFVGENGPVARVLSNIETEDAFLLKCVAAAGQAHVLRVTTNDPVTVVNKLRPLVQTLRNVERFYDMLGGLVGYQLMALELIHEQFGGPPPCTAFASDAPNEEEKEEDDDESVDVGSAGEGVVEDDGCVKLHIPTGPDLREDGGAFAARAASWGIEELPRMAEVYPLGGAGDRLGLVDEVTGESLPAALLMYNGRTLIEGLLRDLWAREWLYYKLYGEQHVTPVAIMTSAAKGNHTRISALMREEGWFGRGAGGFRLFEQPLVPVVTTRGGRWVLPEDDDGGEGGAPGESGGQLNPALKPGGHGAIWKLMHDQGVFTWLAAKGREGGVVRQITNPMAGTDTTLLALSGVGAKNNKALGFASCERHLGAAEGVNVLVEKRNPARDTWSYGISNVEYTVLAQHGISDEPVAPGSTESAFPANTNVLYIGLKKVREALLSSPRGAFPGMLVNLSKPVTADGTKGGRLETSMQNIADVLMQESQPGQRLEESEWGDLPTFILHTLRRRITSSAKKKRDMTKPNPNLAQTPDGSFLDLLKNASDLLDRCGVSHPPPEGGTPQEYLDSGPGFIFCCHPAIGPLWDVTVQKIKGGNLADRAEVRLEVAELQWEDVRVDGSLLVNAEAPLGGDPAGALEASSAGDDDGAAVLAFDDELCGRVRMRDVRVSNRGIDWKAAGTIVWSASLTRHETCEIVLRGNAEFDAEGVALEGDVRYDVPSGWRLALRPGVDGGVEESWTHLPTAAAGAAAEAGEMSGCSTWRWVYEMGEDSRVKLSMQERQSSETLQSHGKSLDEAMAALGTDDDVLDVAASGAGDEDERVRAEHRRIGHGADVEEDDIPRVDANGGVEAGSVSLKERSVATKSRSRSRVH